MVDIILHSYFKYRIVIKFNRVIVELCIPFQFNLVSNEFNSYYKLVLIIG